MHYTNGNEVNEQIDVKEETGYRKGSFTYKHPSYGMVRFARKTCSGEGVPLFGAKHPSTNVMSLEISKAQNNQDLGKNWYYSYESIVNVDMTPVQYAELISNPNVEGVPCTITYTNKEGCIKYKPHATIVEHTEAKIKDSLNNLSASIKDKKERAKELLTQKGGLRKADKEELLNLVLNMDSKLQSDIPWYKEQFEKALVSMVMETNSDIESLVQGVQTKLGKKLLDNPDVFDILIRDEKIILEDRVSYKGE